MLNGKHEALAIALEVNPKDLECLIMQVYSEMLNDGLGEYFTTVATEKEKVEIISAYVSNARNKFESFCVAYSINDQKRLSFNNYIYKLTMRGG